MSDPVGSSHVDGLNLFDSAPLERSRPKLRNESASFFELAGRAQPLRASYSFVAVRFSALKLNRRICRRSNSDRKEYRQGFS